ncbi:MAG: hypothetical protein A2381_02745 [Bdellovibrionales bacterium RIFOXYB1_FULL_37_110]|nr:MAG: hypothetical protein A2181_05125 [Bdellovibrionales bacterium RIFOXYA1_FULL_38_20]OFZ52616.1 MAG: hypothetical protein A2417_01080 [Bdellovibrionales bacterium RIFOXYC1_FULL_37_79]OFZ58306.1 MAG: hypothetical protein A2381_02745 [Bdellovibrionales bacterium RIFOXYB1_FULL_37_110]OFZ65275.1 MAG: hypothetical protein A2577_03970 [Bdellovibrionales bacterium RIFOXYD1_FULL_36_51]
MNLIFNVIIPAIILTKFSTHGYLGPSMGVIVALSFPVTYGLYDLIKNKKWNYISILGITSVLLTGGLALFKFNAIWFAVKEAAIPLIIAIIILVSMRTKYSVLEKLILNPKFFDIDLINRSIATNHAQDYSKKLFSRATLFMALSFLLSAMLNFILAIVILKSPADTPEFNNELGKMTALSLPVIMIPSMIAMILTFWYLTKGLKKATGLDFEKMVKSQK